MRRSVGCRASDLARYPTAATYTRAACADLHASASGSAGWGAGRGLRRLEHGRQPEPTGRPADFPAANGRTVDDLASMAPGQGPVRPSVSIVHKGVNRFGMALFDAARKQITGAEVAVYTGGNEGSGVRGPYVARSESLAGRSSRARRPPRTRAQPNRSTWPMYRSGAPASRR